MSYRGDRGRGGGGGGGGFRGGDRGGFRGGSRGGPGGGRGAPREPGGIFAAGQPANIDARLSDKSEQALVVALRNVKLERDDLPMRPDFGEKGRVIKLRANYFPIKIREAPLFEYDVSMEPSVKPTQRRLKRRIFHLAEKTRDWAQKGLLGKVAHDHSTKLLAAQTLPQPLEIRVPYYDEDEDGPKPNGPEYTVTIEFAREVDTQGLLKYIGGQADYRGHDILPAISALNVILAAHPTRAGGSGVMVGRNKFFFPTDSAPTNLGGGLEAWRGFYSSVRPAHHQLMVNVNACTTAFYKPGNLAKAMNEFREASHGARVGAFVKGVRVQATHLGYKKTVKAMSKETAATYKFDTEDFGRVSVQEYFKRKYRITLKFPNMPLVDVGGQRTNLLPAEICEVIPGQHYLGKLTDDHTAAMITVAAKPPSVNANFIVHQGLGDLGFRAGAAPLGAFGISIGAEMTVVPGRILPPPMIRYGKGTPKVDDRASWNLRDVRFAKGASLSTWAVLVIKDGNTRDEFTGPTDPELISIIKGFADMCRTCGMAVEKKEPHFFQVALPPKEKTDGVRSPIFELIRTSIRELKFRPTLVLVILSGGDKHVYAAVKHAGDVLLDVATVCVHSAKIRKERGQLQYYANVALKVNMKMGGINHLLDPSNVGWLNQTPTMLVGIDVTHPGPASVKGTPSIAAVVASVDSHYAQYPASMGIQESKKEMVTNLAQMMQERLLLFHERNKRLPQRVLVYRDGVSEGQFAIVVGEELPAIKAAFRRFDTPKSPYNPKLTIVICGKRHHTRFYPTEGQDGDSNGNPKAGTVVDRGVTSVYNFDFFLQAHGGLQGTTRPTHYYVVHDEIGFKSDELQGLTNSISYMFARATKAVSLVSPAYYADLACERGRCYLHKLLMGFSTTPSEQTGAEEMVMEEAKKAWRNGVGGASVKDTMFYL